MVYGMRLHEYEYPPRARLAPPFVMVPYRTPLRSFRLGYNDISADGALALASLLHAGSSALECLELQVG